MGVFLCWASYSTRSSLELAEFIRESYEFVAVECKMIVRGAGDTYLVTVVGGDGSGSRAGSPMDRAGNQFVWRVYRADQRSVSQIRAETDLLLALKERDIPVSWPIADRFGEVIQSVNAIAGKRWCFHVQTMLFGPLENLRGVLAHDPEAYAWMQKAVGSR
jgi:hypothetical protein